MLEEGTGVIDWYVESRLQGHSPRAVLPQEDDRPA